MTCQQCGCIITEPDVRFCPQCGTQVQQKQPTPQNKSEFAHDLSAVWPEWSIVKQLGRGAFGVVYEAVRKDNNLESRAAIKVISIPSDSSEIDTLRSEGLDATGTQTYFQGVVNDFVNEIQLMESLKGIQNIVSVEDYKVIQKTDSIGWDIYIRMELLTPFNTYICDKALTEDEIIKLGCDICTALEICEKRNIIHRDIKPENIFINDFGYFKLGDFGIARKLENLTGGLSQKGTLSYMAPEIVSGDAYDARVDTYSLGIVLYRLLNGNRLPFLSDKQLLNPNERRTAVERRLHGEMLPVPCNASANMGNLILRACSFNPAERFANATDMKKALLAVQNNTYVPVLINTASAYSVAADKTETTIAVRKAEKVAASPAQNEPKKPAKKGKIITIAVLSSIAALILLGVILFFTSPAYRVKAALEGGKYASALSDFRADVRNSAIQKALLNMLISDYDDDVLERFNGGNMEFADAQQALSTMKSMGFGDAAEKLTQVMTSHSDNILAKFNNKSMSFGDANAALKELAELEYDAADTKRQTLMDSYAKRLVAAYQDKTSDYDTVNGSLQTLKNDGFSKVDEYIAQLMDLYAKDIVAQYNTDTMPYETALGLLNSLKENGYVDADTMIEQLVTSEEANEALAKGDQYYENGNYENAISEYSKIPESDDNYAQAQEKLNNAYAGYIADTAASVKRSQSSKNYKSALSLLNTAYAVLPDAINTAELDSLNEECLAAYKSQVSTAVTELLENDDYTGAFAAVDETISFSNDAFFQELKATAEAAYVKDVTATVQNHLNDEDYVSAQRVVDNALTILPDNADLKALQTKVKNATPTYFLDVCSPYESEEYWTFVNGETTNMGGEKYTNTFVLGEYGYAIFNLGDKYSSVSFTVGHIDGTWMNDATIKIYCDGVLKKEFYVSCEALPERMTIDVTGVKQLKITRTYSNNSNFGFGNAIIK